MEKAFQIQTAPTAKKSLAETLMSFSAGSKLLKSLLDRMVILPEEWDEQTEKVRKDLFALDRPDFVIDELVSLNLLSPFQAEAISSGMVADLAVGHYRILDLLGQGGMGTVYRAEHIHLRRTVALKLMSNGFDGNRTLMNRFFLEARAIARLQHPNLVSCLDAGRHESEVLGRPDRCYYVMELIPGQDLGKLVNHKGPLSVNRAAGLFRQVAQALAEAHRHGLIHRDIKPANIFVTPDWQIKILDFGLALHPHQQITNPGEFLGTVGYMAPEQSRQASTVNARADLFSLGATLFLALTGKEPFLDTGNAIRDLVPRLTSPPPRIRSLRPDLPAELDDLVARLMDPEPDKRYQSAFEVGAALTPFTRWKPPVVEDGTETILMKGKILIADDDANIRRFIRLALDNEYNFVECCDGAEALNLVEAERFDLMIVDMNMPRVDGAAVIEAVRNSVINSDTMIMLCSGDAPTETLGNLLLNGADDFVQKPLSIIELRTRIRGLMNRRGERAQAKHADSKSVNLTLPPAIPKPTPVVANIHETVRIQANDLIRRSPIDEVIELNYAKRESHIGTVIKDLFTSASVLGTTCGNLLEEANIVSRGHGTRLSLYIRSLAAEVTNQGQYRKLSESQYVEMLAAIAPMHDIGCLIIPGNLFQKAGQFTPDERMVIQTHATAGSEMLVDVAAKYAQCQPYLTLACEVIRSHHERWDGSGYPDQLVKQDIPLSARMVNLVSVYDSLRCRRPFRPAISHARALQMICDESEGHFDPVLLSAFVIVAKQFEQIYLKHHR